MKLTSNIIGKMFAFLVAFVGVMTALFVPVRKEGKTMFKGNNFKRMLSFVVALAMTIGGISFAPVTAYADNTETLLTTITATAKEQASYSVENVATVLFSYTTKGSSSYLNNGKANWGWWGYGFTATVTPADGYTITKCVFYDDKERTATDSEAPFVVETTEEDKTPKVNGTPILANQSKGITKIEVYGYVQSKTATITLNTNGGTINTGNITEYEEGTGATLPTDVTRDGYTFGGWYANEDCTGTAVTEISTTDTGAKTFYAKWIPNTYKVTYNTNGGNTIDEVANVTALPSTLPTPTKTGYTFDGWYTDSELTTQAVAGASISANTTLYAKWTPNTYTVTYNTNGGNTIDEVANVTALPSTLPTPIKTGYTFDGWYTDSKLTTKAVAGASISANTTLYAKWTENTPATYTVTYNTNGGNTIDNVANVTALPSKLPTPTKTGYTFDGWYTDSKLITKAVAGASISANTTLYAKWTENTPATYTVTYNTNGGNTIDNVANVTALPSKLPTPTKTGYTFDGWYTDSKLITKAVAGASISANTTLYAKWTENTPATYKVTFNSKGGSDVASSTVNSGSRVSKPTNPTRDGYTFLGWSTEETSSTYYDFDTAVTSSFTLYAQWEKKVETGVSDTSDIAVAVEGLTDAIDTSDLNANQYVTSEIEVKNEAVSDVSTTVSNKVSEVKGTDSSITVNYLTIDISKIITTVNANGSTTDGTKTAVTELTKPIEVAIPNIDGDKVDIVREHVGTATQFTERNSRNTVPVSFVDGEYYYDKANKIVYIYSSKFSTYAILIKPANNTGGNTGGNPGGNTGGNTGGGTGGGGYSGPTYYTVTFNSNGGSTVTSQSVRSGNKVTKPADPTKEGYTFDGWYTTNSLTTEFDFNTAIYSSRTLYAKWTENTTPTPTVTTYQITYDLDGGTVAKANPTSYTKDTATFTLNNPTKSGYTFEGWVGTGLSEATKTVTIVKGSTGNRVYKATWEKNSDSSSEEDSSPVTPNGKTEEQNALTLNAGLKVSQTGKKITVKFGKVAGATSYEVYVAYCGQKFPTKATATTKKNSVSITKVNGKKLNLKKNFKVVVVAKKSKAKLGKTITAHVVGRKNVKYTNAKSIKITSKTALTLKKGKKSQIKAKTILVDSKKKQLTDAHAKEFRYASSNKKVATVSKTGKITAKGKGTATIYVYSRNGYAKKVKVTVK